MFLLHINKTKAFFNDSVLNIKQLNFLRKQLVDKIKFLNILKQNKKTKSLSLVLKKNQVFETPIKYIVGVSLSNTNSSIYVTDIKGKVQFFLSAGSLGLSGKQKTKKPAVLIKLLRALLNKKQFKKKSCIALHLKNFTKFYTSIVLSLLKKHLKVAFVRVFNNKPHNGCRPKKLKRKKRRRVSFS